MEGLRRRLATLTDAQRAALAARVLDGRGDGDRRIPRRAADGDRPPASFAQERLWFVESLRPEHGAYNIGLALPLLGPLSVRAVAEALRIVVERHEPLRTTLELDGARLVQVIHPPAPVAVPLVDLGRIPAAERAAELDRIAGRELELGFDLERGPVLRAVLVRSHDDDHTLLVTTHHVCSDGWSVGVLRRELRATLAALARGGAPRLAPLPIQYADYAVWQRARHAAGAFEPHLEHWRRALAGAPPALELPLDRPRPPSPSLAGAWRGVALSPAVARQVAEAARAHRTTPFAVLLAAYAVVLHRSAGQDDVVIGIPIANRNRLELEGLIGFFVNALPIRITLGKGDRFADVIARAREATQAAQQHQELPFEQLVEALAPARDPSRHPIFQASFAFHNLPTLDAAAAPDPEHGADVVRGSIKFDLSLHLREAGGALAGSLGWASDLFTDETGAVLAERFVQVVTAGAADPARRLDELVVAAPAAGAGAVGEGGGGGADGALEVPPLLREAGPGLALGGDAPLTWRELAARARAALDAAPAGPIRIEGAALADAMVGVAAAWLGGRELAIGEARVAPGALAAVARGLAAGLPAAGGATVAPARLGPRELALAAAVTLAAGGCASPPPLDEGAAAYVDHVTWEGASAGIVDGPTAAAIAAGAAVPLHGLALIVVGGPLAPSVARTLCARGAAGVVLTDAGEPWAFAAPLAEAARRPLLGAPTAGAAAVVVDAAGQPAPRVAAGWLAVRRGGALVATELRARLCADGAIELAAPAAADPAAAPLAAGPLVEVLAAIWRDVLGRPVGLDDDFFAAGGHSLRATQVVARIRDLLRVALPLQQVFASRTLRQLAAWIEAEPARGAAAAARAEEILRVAAMSDAEVDAALAARAPRAAGEGAPWT